MKYKERILLRLFIGLKYILHPLYKLIKNTQLSNTIKQAINLDVIYKKNFSIGIFVGTSHISFSQPRNIKNPVLTAKDVTDVSALFVADPFMIQKGHTIYMFFEVFNTKSVKGEIGLAKSDDGFYWKYNKIILSEPFHLSYPYVFEYNNNYYMIPESEEDNAIRLYKADDFPTKWSYVKTILKGKYVDSSIFYYMEKWWLFTAKGNDSLLLFYTDNLMCPWKEHPKSPLIIEDPHIARPGGRVLVVDGKIIRFAQDDHPKYGLKVHAFEITELSTEAYAEKIIGDSVLKPSGIGWNAGGMHHLDAQKINDDEWIACVDGWSHRTGALIKPDNKR